MSGVLHEELRSYIASARWYGGKGRDFTVTGTRRLSMPPLSPTEDDRDDRAVVVELVDLAYADGATDTYQVPVSYYTSVQEHLAHALIGHGQVEGLDLPGHDDGEVWAYDALHDHAATPQWLRAFAEGASSDDLAFHVVGSPELDVTARSALMSGEQSNSSVIFGDVALMKLFRRVTPGNNPDIEILSALTGAGNEHVAALYGWVGTVDEQGRPLQLGILQQFLRTASDGWDLALASLRNLFASGDVSARDAGGDFASEAHRLGVAVADLHVSMAEAFGTQTWSAGRLGELADTMSARLDAAVAVVPELRPLAGGLHAHFDAVRHLDREAVSQRVHGDLHLGQTLRTVKNWKIIDFEGEPAKELAERVLPDICWRDVAGMLRSFDYAAELGRLDHEEATAEDDDEARAREWSQRNTAAFLSGYRDASGREVDGTLLTAYVVDKAVYEVVYEARNRPAWLPIPLAAVTRLVGS